MGTGVTLVEVVEVEDELELEVLVLEVWLVVVLEELAEVEDELELEVLVLEVWLLVVLEKLAEVEDKLELEVLVVLEVWLLVVLEELPEVEDELELEVLVKLVEVEDELEPEMPVSEELPEELPVEAVPVEVVLVDALPVAEVDNELEVLVLPVWLLAALEELTPEALPVPEPECWPVLDVLRVKLAENDPCPVASEHGGGGTGDGQVVSVFLTTTVTTSLGGVVTVREWLPWWSTSALAATPETSAVMAKSD